MRTHSLLLIAAMTALAACGGGREEEEQVTGDAAEALAAEEDVELAGTAALPQGPIPTEPVGWVGGGLDPSEEAIAFSDGTGGTSIQIACLTEPGRLRVVAPALEPVESEERLTLSAGDYLAAMPVTDTSGGRLIAEAPLNEELVAALGSAQEIGLSYGAEVIGPVAAPDDGMREQLSNGCRAALSVMTAGGAARADGPRRRGLRRQEFRPVAAGTFRSALTQAAVRTLCSRSGGRVRAHPYSSPTGRCWAGARR